MDNNSTTVPDKGQTTTTDTVPDSSQAGQTTDIKADSNQSVPDNLKGKDSNDLIKMYGDLERKLGEQGAELGQKRKFEQEMGLVLQAIHADPNIKASVEKELKKIVGVKDPDNTASTSTTDSKPDKTTVETRQAVESQILGKFEEKHGLDSLPADKKAEVYKKIGDELAEMLDPGGTKTYAQVLGSVNLMKLPGMLDKALFLAEKDQVIAKATEEGRAKAQVSRAGAIGTIPSFGTSSGGDSLSADERDTAKKLGISEKDYLDSKKKGYQ